jgi:hypothetical protein
MSKLYTVLNEFYHKNVIVPVNEVISLTEQEAKYLKHVLQEVVSSAEEAVDEVFEVVDEVVAVVTPRGRKGQTVATAEKRSDEAE